MKKFFTTTFACVLGTFIAGMLLMIIGIISLTGMIAASASQETAYIPEKNTVLQLSLSGELQERYTEDPMQTLLAQGNSKSVGLDQIRKAIKVATENDNIVGIYIDANGMSCMPASSEEIHRLLADFKKESGKWIYAYADNYTQNDYIIASVADSIIINPIGTVDIHGMGGIQIFYPGLFNKIGIEYQIFRVGTYKSAVEPYINTQMSEANREQTLAYLNTIWETFSQNVTSSRNFDTEHFDNVANAILALRPTRDILAYNLADTTMYRPQFDEWLKTKIGLESDKEIKFATVEQLASITTPEVKSENNIAIVYAVGGISEIGSDGINSKNLVPELTKIKKDEKVKAVVLRVNSPGGSAYASEQIWAELEAIQEAGKKVIVSMGDMAASGGYYISCGADYIFAENTTLTGSIGVFGAVPTAEKLFTDKLGLSFDEARTHKYGNPLNGDFLYRPFGNSESIAMQRSVEECYDLFTRRCAEGRGMSQDDIKKIAEGRVWVGKTALELGLVDSIGGLQDAIAYAAQECHLPEYKVVEYPKQKNSFERLMEQIGQTSRMSITAWLMGVDVPYLYTKQEIENFDYLQCRMEETTIE